MLPALDDKSFDGIARALAPFDVFTTLGVAGGLSTVPRYATASIRLDALANLALLHCRGTRRPKPEDLRLWVDDILGVHSIAEFEDPLEDVFVSAVSTPGGTYRIFEGTWECNDGHLQAALDVLLARADSPSWRRTVRGIRALLTLSEEVCRRCGLQRWLEPEEVFPRRAILGKDPPLAGLADKVTFGKQQLGALGIAWADVSPFVANAHASARDEHDGPPFERRPLARFDNRLVLASPSSVSPAVRAYILECAARQTELDGLQEALAGMQAARLFRALRGEGRGAIAQIAPSLLGDRPPDIRLHESVLLVDGDKLAHVIVLHDDLQSAVQDRIGALAELPEETNAALVGYILQASTALAPLSPAGGMTLVAFAGLGRGSAMSIPNSAGTWRVAAASVDDLVMLVQDAEWSLLRLWRLLCQEESLATAGVQLVNLNGLLNLAAFWQHQGFSLVPASVPYPPSAPSSIIVANDFVRRLRVLARRSGDVHAVRSAANRYLRVRRLITDSFFNAQRDRPIYAVPEAVGAGILMGVVEAPHLVAWLVADARNVTGGARDWTYQIWEATLVWLDLLLGLVASHVPHATPPIRIDFRLDEPAAWENLNAATIAAIAPAPVTAVRTAPHTIRLNIAPGFIPLLAQPTNLAERSLVLEIARHLPTLVGNVEEHPWPATDVLVDLCFGGAEAKQLHLFEGSAWSDPIARVGIPNPLFAAPEERTSWELGRAWRVPYRGTRPISADDQVVAGRADGVQLLHQLVETLWEDLRRALTEFDREKLVRAALDNAEELQRDREIWRRTSRALINMPTTGGEAARVAAARESDRAIAMTACRTLVEMGVCECPTDGGRPVGHGGLETLMAGVALLLEYAIKADALRNGPPAPGVRLRPNGYVQVVQPWLESVASPYVRASFDEGLRADIATYERHLAGRAANNAAASDQLRLPRHDFDLAFEKEYAITPEHFDEATAEFMDWGAERGESIFVVSREELAERLASRRGLSLATVNALLTGFALAPRPRWDGVSPAYTDADWYPWRFRRRLSLIARPLVLLDDPDIPTAHGGRVVVAVGQLARSRWYLLSGLRAGWFQQAYVNSRAMKSYLGAAADRHGAEFTQLVAGACRAAGWQARTEIKMTQLGASAAFGDLDVVAWKSGDPRLLCIECKRLRPARTVDEILDVLTRFAGKAKDLLAKHLARIAWLRANTVSVARGLNAPIADLEVWPLLVTNAVVPMQFAFGLPLPSDRIVAVDQLASILASHADPLNPPGPASG